MKLKLLTTHLTCKDISRTWKLATNSQITSEVCSSWCTYKATNNITQKLNGGFINTINTTHCFMHHITCIFPSTRATERFTCCVFLSITYTQILWAVLQVSQNKRMHTFVVTPIQEALDISFNVEVSHAVCQRCWHTVAYSAITFTVACCDETNILVHWYVVDSTLVQHLVCNSLYVCWSCWKLIKEHHQRLLNVIRSQRNFFWQSPRHTLVVIHFRQTMYSYSITHQQTEILDIVFHLLYDGADES